MTVEAAFIIVVPSDLLYRHKGKPRPVWFTHCSCLLKHSSVPLCLHCSHNLMFFSETVLFDDGERGAPLQIHLIPF